MRCPVGEDFWSTTGLINMRISFLMGCWVENIRRLSSKGDTRSLKCSNRCSVSRIYQQLNYHPQVESTFSSKLRGLLHLQRPMVSSLSPSKRCLSLSKLPGRSKTAASSISPHIWHQVTKARFSVFSSEGEASHEYMGLRCHIWRVRGAQMSCCTGQFSMNDPPACLHMSGQHTDINRDEGEELRRNFNCQIPQYSTSTDDLNPMNEVDEVKHQIYCLCTSIDYISKRISK